MTHTTYEQKACEEKCAPLLARPDAACPLLRDAHAAYLLSALEGLPAGFVSLDASRAWLVYWSLHGVDVLGKRLPEGVPARIVGALRARVCVL